MANNMAPNGMRFNPVTNQWENPSYPQQYASPQSYPPQQSVTFAIVEGDNAVENYLVGTNVKAILLDFTNMKVHIKGRDANNIPIPRRTFTMSEIVQPSQQPQQFTQPEVNQNDYVTKEQFDELKAMIAGLAQQNQTTHHNEQPRGKQKGGSNN